MKTKENTKKNPITNIASSDITGIIRFYERLVPDWKLIRKPCNIEKVLEAFPKFEETIGEKDFAKVKKYFGIGVKKNSQNKFDLKIEGLVKKLRTVENAMLYVEGYDNLIKDLACKLDYAPDYMGDIEKAKLVRAYFYIFVGGQFFLEEYKYVSTNESDNIYVVKDSVEKRNKLPLTPEDFFVIYDRLFTKINAKSLIYDSIIYELNSLDSKLKKDFLDFSELTESNGKLISVNCASNFQTFGDARKIKKKYQYEPTFYPANVFAHKQLINHFTFSDLYSMYKITSNVPLAELSEEIRQRYIVEGSSRVKKVGYTCYLLNYKNFSYRGSVAGELEKGRFLNLINILAKHEYQIPFLLSSDDKECNKKYINMGLYMSAYKYAFAKNYISIDSCLDYDFEVLEQIVEIPGAKEHLMALWNEKESISEFETHLDIDSKTIDNMVFKIKERLLPVEDDISAGTKFALETSCIANDSDEISKARKLLQAYILPVFKQNFLDYAKDNNLEKLKKDIGFNKDFSNMYFNLTNVKVTQIEEKLVELKRNSASIKYFKLLVLLYCYLVDNQIPCGVKNKPIKRKKNLKTEILLNLAKKY